VIVIEARDSRLEARSRHADFGHRKSDIGQPAFTTEYAEDTEFF